MRLNVGLRAALGACGLAAGLAVCAPPAVRGEAGDGSHFRFSGPMSLFLAPGASAAPVSSGLPFSLVLTEGGKSSPRSRTEWKQEGWNGPAVLEFEGLAYGGGRLTGTALLRNESGAALEGLRLDLTGATEEYRTKDGQGNEVLKTRPQPVSFRSPLFFGDLAAGDESDALPLGAGTLTFAPETTRVTVNGVLSGLRYQGQFSVGELTPYEIDTDARGRVYVAAGDRIVRTDADGKNAADLVKTDGIGGAAVDRKTGEVVACAANDAVIRYSPEGKELGRITVEKNGIEFPTLGIRLDGQRRAYNCGDNQRVIQCIEDGNKAWEVSVEAGSLFDVDPAGTLYACVENEVRQWQPGGKAMKKLATGPDWHFGRLYSAQSCRVGPSALLYVAQRDKPADENGKGGEASRISVFDRDGRVVRVWGRGGKAPVPDQVLPGQVFNPVDLAFGPNGMCYVLCPVSGGEVRVLEFQMF